MCNYKQVHIVLPPLTALMHTTYQMGKISQTIKISANRAGHLSVRAESDAANVQTDWTDLKVPEVGEDPQASEAEQVDKMAFETVALDQKSFLKFLNSHVIANTTIACMLTPLFSTPLATLSLVTAICKNFACICYVYIGAGPAGGGVLTYAEEPEPRIFKQLRLTVPSPLGISSLLSTVNEIVLCKQRTVTSERGNRDAISFVYMSWFDDNVKLLRMVLLVQ